MSLYAFMGSIEQGLVFAIMALGVFITFRALDFPDLSVDGSFPMGAAISATLIVNEVDPLLSIVFATIGGTIAGTVTAILNTKLKILNLLSGILVMIALYSINLRIMGMPTVSLLGYETIFTPLEELGYEMYMITPVVFGVITLIAVLFLIWFFHTDLGLALRATGDNMKMVRAQGASTNRMIIFGVALSNGFVALSGALVAQSQGSADVNMGIGTIVAGLASVIVGEAIVSSRSVLRAVVGVVIGSILYRLAIAFALTVELGPFQLTPSDLNLITSILVICALMFPGLRRKIGLKK